MKRRHWYLFAAAALVSLAAGTANASYIILFDNLNNTLTTGSLSVANAGPLAASFSTGASSVDLADVKLDLNMNQEPPTPYITVALFSDSSTSPGTQLTTIGTLSDGNFGSPGVYDFPLSTSYLLAANTRYWIELSSSTNSSQNWDTASTATGTGVASEYYSVAGTVSANNGASSTPFQMQVNADPATPSAAPAPASIWLLSVGAAGLMGYSRLRRMKAAWIGC